MTPEPESLDAAVPRWSARAPQRRTQPTDVASLLSPGIRRHSPARSSPSDALSRRTYVRRASNRYAPDSVEPAKYLPEVGKTSYDGVTALIAFDEFGDLKGGAISVYQYKGGKLEYVETLGGGPVGAVKEAAAEVKDAAKAVASTATEAGKDAVKAGAEAVKDAAEATKAAVEKK